MKLTQFFAEQLEKEVARTRGALKNIPEGKDDWAPHPKSMPLLRLAGLVASMPSWFALIINQDELELSPPAGQGQFKQPTVAELVSSLDKALKDGRAAFDGTTDDYLLTTKWKLLVKGNVVMEQSAPYRHLRDVQSSRASSRTVDGVPAPARSPSARDLWTVGRRSALRVICGG